jgi:hypothetical protein
MHQHSSKIELRFELNLIQIKKSIKSHLSQRRINQKFIDQNLTNKIDYHS